MPTRYPADDPREWLNRAGCNFFLAKTKTPRVYNEELCFNLHETAQKALKAVILARTQSVPETRNLESLLAQLGEDAAALAAAAALLAPYETGAEYPIRQCRPSPTRNTKPPWKPPTHPGMGARRHCTRHNRSRASEAPPGSRPATRTSPVRASLPRGNGHSPEPAIRRVFRAKMRADRSIPPRFPSSRAPRSPLNVISSPGTRGTLSFPCGTGVVAAKSASPRSSSAAPRCAADCPRRRSSTPATAPHPAAGCHAARS
jgi:HEPN domain-containing protein